MRYRVLGFALCLVTAATAIGEVGDLTPTGEFGGEPLIDNRFESGYRDWKRATRTPGVTWPKAMMVRLRGEKDEIAVALDAADRTAKVPDVIRFNFTGAAKFNTGLSIPLTDTGKDSFYSKIGPAVLNVTQNGKTVPVKVNGYVRYSDDYCKVRFWARTALVGTCKFDQQEYPVTIIDGNNNLSAADKTIVRQGRYGVQTLGGDTVSVTVGSGDDARQVKAFIGQPILIDGAWYRTKLIGLGKIVATPAKVESGQIRIAHEDWYALLTNGAFVLPVRDTTEPITVPAGRYRVMKFYQAEKNESGEKIYMWCSPSKNRGMGKPQKVAPDAVTELTVGGPVEVWALAKVRRRSVRLDFKMTDAGGLGVDYLGGKDRNRPTPGVEIFDARGNKVHEANFEYG